MPHIVIEYSNNLKHDIAASGITKVAHKTVVASGLFSPEAVKARSIGYDDYALPDGAKNFIHITVSILEGRSNEAKAQLSRDVFDNAKSVLPSVDKLSVNIHDMNKESYTK